MKNLKQILKQANIIPGLKLVIDNKPTGAHTVKLIKDKIVNGKDYYTGEDRLEVKLLVEEKGEKKQYCFPVKDKHGEVHYLVERLAEFEPEDEIIMEAKRKGKIIYIDVRSAKENGIIKEEDIESNEVY